MAVHIIVDANKSIFMESFGFGVHCASYNLNANIGNKVFFSNSYLFISDLVPTLAESKIHMPKYICLERERETDT